MQQPGHRQTIVLDRDMLLQLEQARQKLTHGSIKPSKSAVVREAVKRGLEALGAEILPNARRAV